MAACDAKETEQVRAVLLEVFGASDDEEDSIEQHDRIRGLHHCHALLSETMQVNLQPEKKVLLIKNPCDFA